jgi:hypothetical protein
LLIDVIVYSDIIVGSLLISEKSLPLLSFPPTHPLKLDVLISREDVDSEELLEIAPPVPLLHTHVVNTSPVYP